MPLKLKWTCTYTTYTPTQLRTHLQSNRPDATALTLQVKCVHPGKNICALCQKFLNLSTSCSRQECDCQSIRIYAVNLPGQQCMAIWVLSNATITIQFFSGNILTKGTVQNKKYHNLWKKSKINQIRAKIKKVYISNVDFSQIQITEI